MVVFHSHRDLPDRVWRMMNDPKLQHHDSWYRRRLPQEGWLRKTIFSLPLLGLFVLAAVIMATIPAIPSARKMMNSGRISWETDSVAILNKFYHVKPLDDM